MNESEPIYSERHRSTFLSNFLWYLGLLLVAAAVLSFAFSSASIASRSFDVVVLLGLGAGLAGGHWLLAPRRYEVHEEGLAVVFGRPRVRMVRYPEVSDIEVRSHALGTEIRVILSQGGVVRIYPLHPREFHENLERAWRRNRGGWPGG